MAILFFQMWIWGGGGGCLTIMPGLNCCIFVVLCIAGRISFHVTGLIIFCSCDGILS